MQTREEKRQGISSTQAILDKTDSTYGIQVTANQIGNVLTLQIYSTDILTEIETGGLYYSLVSLPER